MPNNVQNLHTAKREKNDEFYTQLPDIEKELKNYDFKDKWVYSNCSDYRFSNFTKYFTDNFEELGLKHYTCTNYDIGQGAYRYDYDGENTTITQLEDNGDFRNRTDILEQADVIVENPPFSLFREYVGQLMQYNKKFIIIGNKNAISYKEIFPLIKNNNLWVGNTPMSYDMKFILPDYFAKEVAENKKEGSGYVVKDGKTLGRAQAIWFTNIDHKKRHETLDLYKKYNPTDYPKYDNYDAIEVGFTCDIPVDYDGVMGVPISFLGHHNPTQFEIVGALYNPAAKINGKNKYFRIAIRRKKNDIS